MSASSSVPRGERAGTPGVAWETRLVRTEVVVDDVEPPAPNRATRRALAKAARRKGAGQ